MSQYKGYMGKILCIDLSSGTSSDYPWTDRDREKYVGGKATASKILFDNLKGTENPLGEENIIVIATGPITGLGAPASNRFNISALSPQTGITASSNCGGNFGYYLKRAGYDGLVIRGKCSEKTWIEIDNGKVIFHGGNDLWGKKISETQTSILQDITKAKGYEPLCGIVTIGPAGENLVKYASVFSGERAAGRAGMGSVFGSKNLKAVVAMGNQMPEAAKPEKLRKYQNKWIDYLQNHPLTGRQLPKVGTAGLVTPMQYNGQLGTENFTKGRFSEFEKVNGEALAMDMGAYAGGCVSCPIHCTRRLKLDNKDVKGPELETLALLGGNILNGNLELICRWNYELDELGMDTISSAQTVAWAMEAKKRGVWDCGLEYGKTDNISQVWEDIAFRRGIGDELAEGTRTLSKKHGGESFAMQSKGLELSAYEPRQAVGQGLGYAVSNRGACHLNGGYLISLEGLGLRINPHTTIGKADLCIFMQHLLESISMGGQCLFTSYGLFPAPFVSKPNSLLTKAVEAVFPFLGYPVRLINRFPELLCFNIFMVPHSKELMLATGMRMTLGKFLRNGERSYNVERAVNARFGVCAEKDKLPKELTDVPQDPNDPTTVVPLEKMKRIYYRSRGWGKDGLPTEKKLRSLGII